jgi:hypothetical protein
MAGNTVQETLQLRPGRLVGARVHSAQQIAHYADGCKPARAVVILHELRQDARREELRVDARVEQQRRELVQASVGQRFSVRLCMRA